MLTAKLDTADEYMYTVFFTGKIGEVKKKISLGSTLLSLENYNVEKLPSKDRCLDALWSLVVTPLILHLKLLGGKCDH